MDKRKMGLFVFLFGNTIFCLNILKATLNTPYAFQGIVGIITFEICILGLSMVFDSHNKK